MKRLCAFAFTLFCGFGIAQTPPGTMLGVEEVKALATGKKWTFVRSNDGNRVRWDLRENGLLYGNNLTRNSTDSGRWKLSEKGEVCTDWKGNSLNTCYGVRKIGDKTELIGPTFVSDLIAVE